MNDATSFLVLTTNNHALGPKGRLTLQELHELNFHMLIAPQITQIKQIACPLVMKFLICISHE